MTERLARASSRRPWLVVGLWLIVILDRVRPGGDVPRVRGRGRDHEDDRVEAGRADPRRGLSQEAANGQAITEVVVVRAEDGEVRAAATRARVAALADELRAAGATGSSPTAKSGASSRRTGTRRSSWWRSAGTGRTTSRSGRRGQRLDDEPGYRAAVTGELDVGRRRGRRVAGGSEEGRALLRRSARAGRPAARLRRGRRGPRAAHARDRLDRGRARAGGAPGAGVRPVGLHPEHADRHGPRARDRLLAVHPLPLSGGAAAGAGEAGRDRHRGRHRRPRRPLQRDRVRARDARAPAGPEHDLPQPGRRRDPGRDRLRDRGADAAARRARAARRPRERASHSLLRTRGRAGGPGGPLLGRDRRSGHAPPGREPRARRRPAARARRPRARARHGTSGAATLPDRFESKQGYLLLREEFPKESTEPVEIAVAGDVRGPAVEGALARLEQELARRPIFGEPTVETNEAGTVARVTVPIAGNPDGERAIEAVRELRSEVVPRAFAGVDAEVYVGGDTAEELDYHDTVDFWLPLVLLFVLGLSFLLLTLAFRSIVVPATAIGMNLLSVGAAYGLLVLVFQEGIGNELLGLREAETIDAWVPLFLFAVLSGSRWTTRSSCSAASASATCRRATPTPPSPSASARPLASSPAPRSSSSPSSGASRWATRSRSSRWASASPSRS